MLAVGRLVRILKIIGDKVISKLDFTSHSIILDMKERLEIGR